MVQPAVIFRFKLTKSDLVSQKKKVAGRFIVVLPDVLFYLLIFKSNLS